MCSGIRKPERCGSTFTQRDGQIVVSVLDDGKGIDETSCRPATGESRSWNRWHETTCLGVWRRIALEKCEPGDLA